MHRRARQIATIAGMVYFSQGALGIASITLPLYLRSMNWSVTQITTATSIAAFPWILKIFYGFLSDSFPILGYRRKSYLVLFSSIAAVGWLFLGIFPPERYPIIFCLMLTNLGFAATDVVTDGLIVEHSTVKTSPIYQGIAWGFRSLGSVVSGFTGGWLAEHWAAYNVFLLTMFLPLIVGFVSLGIREKRINRATFEKPSTPFRKCFNILKSGNIKWFIAILLVAGLPASFGVPFFFFMKETLGFRETFLGFLISIGWAGGAIGSLVYVKGLRRVSPKIILRWAIILNSVNILSTLFILGQTSALILVVIGGVMGVLTMLPIMSVAATLTHGTEVESTLFAILMSLYNLSQIVFGYIGGWMFSIVGIYPLIIGSGVLTLIGLLFVNRLDLKPYPVTSYAAEFPSSENGYEAR